MHFHTVVSLQMTVHVISYLLYLHGKHCMCQGPEQTSKRQQSNIFLCCSLNFNHHFLRHTKNRDCSLANCATPQVTFFPCFFKNLIQCLWASSSSIPFRQALLLFPPYTFGLEEAIIGNLKHLKLCKKPTPEVYKPRTHPGKPRRVSSC